MNVPLAQRVSYAIGSASLLAAVFSLVVPDARLQPAPAAAATVRASAPDFAASAEVAPGLTLEPVWTVGDAPSGGVVATRGERPRPHSAFERTSRDRHWTVWRAGDETGDEATEVRLREHVRGARVALVSPDGARTPCDRWIFGRWQCPGAAWGYVGPATVTSRGRANECIWAHPHEGQTLEIAFDDLPRADLLRGRFMLADDVAELEGATNVDLIVRVDGEVVDEQRRTPRRGVSNFRTDIPEGDDTMSLVFEVSAEDVGQRHFCFDGTLRPPREEP